MYKVSIVPQKIICPREQLPRETSKEQKKKEKKENCVRIFKLFKDSTQKRSFKLTDSLIGYIVP